MQLWRRRAIAAVLAALPSVAFVVVNAASSLGPALIVAGAVGLVAFAWQLRAREPLWQAAAGLVILGACAGIALATGQARGFFLLPMLVPFTLILLGSASLLARRPMVGVILNRVSGGPPDWRDLPQFRRIYTIATVATIAFNVLSAVVQVSLYEANQTIALGATHVVTGPTNLAISAVTFVLVRRATSATPRPAAELAT